MALQDVDQNMWKAYGAKLFDTFMQGTQLGPDQRFFLAPLSQAGIAASATGSIPTAIMNQGVFTVSNTLLSLNSPCYIPTTSSYFDRCLLQLGSVYLDTQNDMGLQASLNMAKAASASAQAQFTATKLAAQTAWKAEKDAGLTTLAFDPWVAQNYPQFAVDQMANSAASAALQQITNQIRGPAAAVVGSYISKLNNVNNGASGYTMPCSTAAADWIKSAGAGTASTAPPTNNLAAYDIQNQYAQEVDNWINTFNQKVKNPNKIEFTMSDFSSSEWSKLGFDNSSTVVSGSAFWFFTATYTENNQTVSKQISLSEAGAQFKITLTYTGFGSYTVNPSAVWNPSELLKLPVVSNAPAAVFQPAAIVTKVFMAYGCGMQIEMSSNCFSEIQSYLQKVQSTNGSASLFGFNIGLGGNGSSSNTSTTTADDVLKHSSGTTITIPPDNNAYPTLLAVIGTALPVPEGK